MTVYNYLNQACHEGTKEECMQWILQWADVLSDGRRFYRTWTEDGYTYYDVGQVFHM